jgi:FADH2 O2-dependent halogenase
MTADVLILGSGFSGSLLGAILARQGMRVVLLDRSRHPRFAIGESSTPVADMLLERMAHRWQLPEIAPLARWGTWQARYPEIGCGLKRGFSYFRHEPGHDFHDTPDHAASLLVAASASDAEADTHWLRSDVDAFLHARALDRGVVGREACTVTDIERAASGWHVRWQTESGGHESVQADRVVDATGGGGLLGQALGRRRLDEVLETRCGAIFSHFTGVAGWDALQRGVGNDTTSDPFPSDDAAQHHLIGGAWVWMLRFTADRCSVGIVVPGLTAGAAADPEGTWRSRLAAAPSVARLLADARALRPLASTGRMARLWDTASGPGWAMLPTTAGFVDPLHSTGIAHALHGVMRLADLLLAERHDDAAWLAYGRAVVDEVRWIDRLVATAYAALDDFPLFTLACHLFFIATIASERRIAAGSDGPGGFLAADDRRLREVLERCAAEVRAAACGDARSRAACRARVARLVAPWDAAGLFAPAAANRHAHTAAAKSS